jgi:hypothetical protein
VQTAVQAAHGISVDFELLAVLAIIPIFIFQLKTKAFCQHVSTRVDIAAS